MQRDKSQVTPEEPSIDEIPAPVAKKKIRRYEVMFNQRLFFVPPPTVKFFENLGGGGQKRTQSDSSLII